VFDGHFGLKIASEQKFDVILIDLMLPYANGLEICKKLRELQIQTPILMLTALGSTDDKVKGLDAGADDYLVKPFDFKELLARIRVLYKRTNNQNFESAILSIADLSLNTETKIVTRNEVTIDLTAKEFLLLEYFLKNKSRVISRKEIAEKVWGLNFDTGTNVIDVYINFLRKKIDKDFSLKLIHTIIGMGYTIRVEQR
jgi:DNA-binding response OmpR family regulator